MDMKFKNTQNKHYGILGYMYNGKWQENGKFKIQSSVYLWRDWKRVQLYIHVRSSKGNGRDLMFSFLYWVVLIIPFIVHLLFEKIFFQYLVKMNCHY